MLLAKANNLLLLTPLLIVNKCDPIGQLELAVAQVDAVVVDT